MESAGQTGLLPRQNPRLPLPEDVWLRNPALKPLATFRHPRETGGKYQRNASHQNPWRENPLIRSLPNLLPQNSPEIRANQYSCFSIHWRQPDVKSRVLTAGNSQTLATPGFVELVNKENPKPLKKKRRPVPNASNLLSNTIAQPTGLLSQGSGHFSHVFLPFHHKPPILEDVRLRAPSSQRVWKSCHGEIMGERGRNSYLQNPGDISLRIQEISLGKYR